MSSNFIRIFFKKNTDLKQVETELSNNLDSNLVLEIDDSIIIDKKIIDFLNSYSKKSKKSFVVVSSNLNYQLHSFTLVPTFQEAKDIIQIEEIERLIARSLRGVIDLEELGPISITVDCDILNADGGTRCASITAANIGLRLAIRRLITRGECIPKKYRIPKEEKSSPINPPTLGDEEKKNHEMAVMKNDVAAISVGLFGDDITLDLDYTLDSNADVDMNIVGTSDGMMVEIQGTGEEATFSRAQLDNLIDYAEIGLKKLHEVQSNALT